MNLKAFLSGIKARIQSSDDSRSERSVVSVMHDSVPSSVHGGSRHVERYSASYGIHVDVPVTVVNESRETIADRVRWGLLSALGNFLKWPFRLVARLAERILNESVSLAFRVTSFLLTILITPLMLWLGYEIAVEYMKNRDAHGAFQYGVNALQELWVQMLRKLKD